ncbi:MAG: hypothetical protein M3320_02430 [Actinomycetota bacterium]|nr:hypothetical protein [Actinomycetota bacterium]
MAGGWRRIAWLGALAAPAVLTLALIAAHGVNTPQHDQWMGLTPLLVLHDRGELKFEHFYDQHNEHRPLVPTAINFGLAQLTGWNIRAELFLNFAVALATFVLVALALRRTLDRKAFAAAAVVSSIIFFSPRQWENWLNGWQLEWFLSNLAALGAFWALTSLHERRPRAGLAVAVGCALVATYSLGQGLLVWPLGLALLLLRRQPWRLWVLVTVVVAFAYFDGYDDPDHHPSKTIVFERPFQFLKYVGRYLGGPFGAGDATGGIAGVLLLGVFAFAAVHVLRRRADGDLFDRTAFWLAAGSYAIGAAVITGVSRLGFGWAQASASRYTTMACLFGIATLALVLAVAPRVDAPRPRALVAGFVVALLVVSLANTTRGVGQFREDAENLEVVAACVRNARSPQDRCLHHARFSHGVGLHYVGILWLRDKGWAGF